MPAAEVGSTLVLSMIGPVLDCLIQIPSSVGSRISTLVAALTLLVVPLRLEAQLPKPTYGYNIGNTLEPPCGEGCWGPAATERLVESIAKAGFNTVRLPVAWNSHADPTSLKIDPAWMARVKEVVDWCLQQNLTVIINSHWDKGWLDEKITESIDPSVDARMRSYWTQIAMTFRNYDSRLLFAGANEPPVNTQEKMATLTHYYQTFVDAVRATGGNNAQRWLIIQGPGTDIDQTEKWMNAFPSDPTPDRLAVEVHYYAPFQWSLMEADAEWGKRFFFWGKGYHHPHRGEYNATWGEEEYAETQLQKMADKFIKRGIPVILGEFQAMTRPLPPDFDENDHALYHASRTYFHRFLVQAANIRGISPIFWDIQGKLFDWTTGDVLDPDNLRAIVGGDALPPPLIKAERP